MITFRPLSGLGASPGTVTADLAPSAARTHATVLLDSVAQLFGQVQTALADIVSSGYDGGAIQTQLESIGTEIDAVRGAIPAMSAEESLTAVSTLQDDQTQLSALLAQINSLRNQLIDGVSNKTLFWGLGAVAAASALGFWIIGRRRERRSARRAKHSRRS